MLLRKSVFSLLIIIFVFGLGTNILFNSASALAATTDWQLITGPTVKVHAVIKPYINITINSPATIQSNLSVEGPAVVFDCNQGPGTYQSLYPLTFCIISNTAFQLQFEATSLVEQNTKSSISPGQLSVRFNDPSASSNTFSAFEEGKKKIIFETNQGASFTTQCDFQLDITYEDKAGTYEGAIFVEVLYQPTS
ncbi:MAG: hypothetical protein ACOX6A_01500 [Atribacter sp.]|uniref:Uncharacterized protein n=1 Tax=Candidatus Atribacter allofermentans TaxID=1852833 RepID=A0A1V5SLB0_9BACT|nr:MAG: hypothetical protein BWY41_01799 [Candidatus Atribacteria bacterium ADurb.Bin276]HHT10249.1 hypothetical protein [Candidatus Atribacteria bacterium]